MAGNIIAYFVFIVFQVVGIDSQGFEFQRTTPTAISPIDPELPTVQMASRIHGFYDEVAVLDCSISSLVPFAVQWYLNGEAIGNRLFYRYTTRRILLSDDVIYPFRPFL